MEFSVSLSEDQINQINTLCNVVIKGLYDHITPNEDEKYKKECEARMNDIKSRLKQAKKI